MRDDDGKYAVVRRLGVGGMAEVFLCRQRGLGGFDKLVVTKQIRDDIEHDECLEMFLDEARVAANLTHANIVQVFEVTEQDGRPSIVMEYVPGPLLSGVLKRLQTATDPLQLANLAYLLAGAAAGLDHAHNARDVDGNELMIVHRDISPHNIIISPDGVPKLFDFGVAKARSNQAMTTIGSIKGKVAYMAPEQLRAQPVNSKADVFALGVCLYEATVGRLPWPGETEAEVLCTRLEHTFPLPSQLVRDYPPELEAIVVAAMSFDPAGRPDAAMLADALEAYATAHGANARTVVAWLARLFPDRVRPFGTGNHDRISVTSGSYNRVAPSVTGVSQPVPSVRPALNGIVIASATIGALAVAAIVYVVVAHLMRSDDTPTQASPPVAAVVEPSKPLLPAPAPAPAPPAVAKPAPAPVAHGTLTVTTRANATVYLDGKPLQQPVAARAVDVGDHEIVAKIPGYPTIHQRVTIEADHDATLDLEPKPAAHPAANHAAPNHPAPVSHPAPPPPPPAPEPKVVASEPESVSPPPAAPTPAVAPRPTIDTAATRQAVLAQIGAIKQCYDRAKMDDATLKGTVTVRITVATNGSVASAAIASSTLSAHAVESCITREVLRFHLPAPTGGPISFSYPFVFD